MANVHSFNPSDLDRIITTILKERGESFARKLVDKYADELRTTLVQIVADAVIEIRSELTNLDTNIIVKIPMTEESKP